MSELTYKKVLMDFANSKSSAKDILKIVEGTDGDKNTLVLYLNDTKIISMAAAIPIEALYKVVVEKLLWGGSVVNLHQMLTDYDKVFAV